MKHSPDCPVDGLPRDGDPCCEAEVIRREMFLKTYKAGQCVIHEPWILQFPKDKETLMKWEELYRSDKK